MSAIHLYPLMDSTLTVEPAKKMREWMNQNVHSYRCVPIAIANQLGWDIILDRKVVAEWNGGNSLEDVSVLVGNGVAKSHFGSGTITIDVGYTWHTENGKQLLIIPVPNDDSYRNFQALSAIVESDKLKYPWFLSVRLVNTGITVIEAGTKLCRVFPISIRDIEDTSISIAEEPQDFKDYRVWQGSERDNKPKDVAWQKFYHNVAEHTSITMKKVQNDKL